MWTPVSFTSDNSVPPSRSKHSAAVHGNHIYVVGGRNGNWPLKDIWRYALSNNTWEQLHPTGDTLQNLQEHTAVVYQDKVYVFGGEVGFSSASESPLWSYSIKDNLWKKVKGKSGSNVPKGRRGHTALVYRNSMIIYGGYRDLKGSTNEMWAFHFDTESWHLLSQGRVLPPARHKHSAIIHDDIMWVYGGMTDLHERSDLWKFDFVKKKWSVLKTKVNPGLLHGHSATKVMGSMIIFGGKKGGQFSNDLWKFYFATETWEKVHTTYPQPPPICEAVTLTVLETTSTSTTKSSRENGVQSPIVVRRSRSGRSADRQQHSGSGDRDHSGHLHQFHHQCRSESRASSLGGSNVNILKEISKLSQLNLYRLAHNKTYSVLSSTDSVVSADASHVQQQQQNMVKSQSANVIARSLISPVVSNASPSGYKSSFPPCRMPRDPMSVPNFGVALTPVEATKLVYLEGEEAPSPRVEFDHDFGSVHMRFHPNGPLSSGSSTLNNKTLNRRSYPMTSSASARFGNPYSTPEEPGEITSGYVSIETVHQSPNSGDGPMCFSNPNYMVADIQNAISKGDYVKLNSPPDSLLEDSDNAFEMRDMNRPAPPKTLALNSSTAFNSSSDVRSSTKAARAASAGRASAIGRGGGGMVVENHQVKEYAVYLLGGTERDGSVTVFKKPMAVWKLSMFFRNVQ
ncbi:uncharacterized protein LOC113549757 [Rhopalosiphum maidis]|uniref:uncharacterized protein LOC113549757 n=1 Tax=Rhopalosiphum maidis TaxID=43146 RepID=UPI000EFE5B54|nr:uncharacterized protein LOC113549757 [Rhopalosiphum maidis]XP_026807020.1 uncharacterized protein LOC113549757 [Rhopalosiphum maidis]XP_026807021.1 uncharacterized protein LOC113549757 [Rhopalosiphum maidis]